LYQLFKEEHLFTVLTFFVSASENLLPQ